VPGKYTTYTIRILTPGGGVASAIDLICASDRDVKLAAQVLIRPYGLEIWDGNRRVDAFPPAGAKAA